MRFEFEGSTDVDQPVFPITGKLYTSATSFLPLWMVLLAGSLSGGADSFFFVVNQVSYSIQTVTFIIRINSATVATPQYLSRYSTLRCTVELTRMRDFLSTVWRIKVPSSVECWSYNQGLAMYIVHTNCHVIDIHPSIRITFTFFDFLTFSLSCGYIAGHNLRAFFYVNAVIFLARISNPFFKVSTSFASVYCRNVFQIHNPYNEHQLHCYVSLSRVAASIDLWYQLLALFDLFCKC